MLCSFTLAENESDLKNLTDAAAFQGYLCAESHPSKFDQSNLPPCRKNIFLFALPPNFLIPSPKSDLHFCANPFLRLQ